MLDFDQQGHIVTLTINRPDMRNALGEPGDGGVFSDAVARINDDRNVRCVIPVSYTHLTLPTILLV